MADGIDIFEDAGNSAGMELLQSTGKLLPNKSIPSQYVDQLSDTSNAKQCYVFQKFSRRLQAYMVNYTSEITSGVPLT